MWLDLGEYHGPSRFHAFLRYCIERTKQRNVTESFRVYVTDSLQNAPQGKYLMQRWSDLTKPHEDIDVDATIDHVLSQLEE